jgi:leucyl aminopeptidase
MSDGPLRIEARGGGLAGIGADLGIAFKFKGDDGFAGEVGDPLARRLIEVARVDRFDGRPGGHLLWHAAPAGEHRCPRYLVAGLGAASDFTLERFRRHLGEALIEADRRGAGSVALNLPVGAGAQRFDPRECGLAAAEGVLLGTYRFDKYRSQPRPGRRHLRQVLIAAGQAPLRPVTEGLRLGETTSAATNFARDLVNEPAGVLTPQRMEEIARAAAKKAGIGVKVLQVDDLRRLGMNGILGVGQGSAVPPRLIRLDYRPAGRVARRVALAGKGLTFDSGGLSLKTSEGMETMKCDMAGSAAVLATLCALPELGPRVEVTGLMGMAENMPGGNALRPGDVLRMMNGKTVEVRNTDAEGRLVLADVLSYVSTFKRLDEAIDLATLTGAVAVALGPLTAGVIGNDGALVDALVRAARRAGESIWPLPLTAEYREHIRSDVADIKNTGIRYGGAITAALFLHEFVRPGLPWAHLDIAGPAFGDKEYSYIRKGGSGYGVRLLLRHLVDASS